MMEMTDAIQRLLGSRIKNRIHMPWLATIRLKTSCDPLTFVKNQPFSSIPDAVHRERVVESNVNRICRI